MFDTPEELIDKIRLGEDNYLELKELRFAGDRVQGPRRDDLANELAAFANARGGVLVLGVDDSTREIVGIPIERMELAERFVAEVARDSIQPELPVVIETMRLPTTTGVSAPVIKVEIERSLFVHKSPGGYFHRVGSSKREMSPDYLARLFAQRSQSRLVRFDEEIVPNTRLEDLERSLCERFRGEQIEDSWEVFLGKLGMASRGDDDVWRPTVAGVLLGASDPREHMSNAFIQAVAYRGETIETEQSGGYQLDALDVSGPLDQQIVDACRFVQRNMRTGAVKGLGRTDIPQYSMTAVFEAIVNAVAHRDYSIWASKVRIRMFSNRLEIFSPGSLPNSFGVDALAYRQASRNETVASLLAKCSVPSLDWLDTPRKTMMDRRGEGVRVILDKSEQLSGRKPEYQLVDESELILTIWAADTEAVAEKIS